MSRRVNNGIKKNIKELDQESAIQKHLNSEKKLIKKLKERKEAYKEFLTQINDFIDYAHEQAKNNDELRIKYLETIEEEESLRDKINEYLKKNDELIESIKKSNFDLES